MRKMSFSCLPECSALVLARLADWSSTTHDVFDEERERRKIKLHIIVVYLQQR